MNMTELQTRLIELSKLHGDPEIEQEYHDICNTLLLWEKDYNNTIQDLKREMSAIETTKADEINAANAEVSTVSSNYNKQMAALAHEADRRLDAKDKEIRELRDRLGKQRK